jgi:membrane protein implicated in regulation of membrane protease activity
MRELKYLFRSLILIAIIIVFFTMVSPVASAETVVKAGEDKTVYVDEEIEFQGVGTGEYFWDFDESKDENGDGDFTNDAEKTGKTVTYKFKETGTYIVTLTVIQGGNITTLESKITVEEAPLLDAWVLGLIFVIIGIIMFLAEASSPGFFIGIPASILVVIGIIGIAFPELFFTIWSPIIAAIVAVVTTVAIITFYKKLAPPEAPTTTVGESLIGKEGIVTADTVPLSSTKGKVKIGSEVWSATSKRHIKKDSRVVVLASEGVHITVEEIKEKSRKRKTSK